MKYSVFSFLPICQNLSATSTKEKGILKNRRISEMVKLIMQTLSPCSHGQFSCYCCTNQSISCYSKYNEDDVENQEGNERRIIRFVVSELFQLLHHQTQVSVQIVILLSMMLTDNRRYSLYFKDRDCCCIDFFLHFFWSK